MKRILIPSIIGLLGTFMFLTTSCTTEPVLPTQKVSFKTDIQPMIISNCTYSGCHGNENTQKGKLLTYADIMKFGEVEAGYAKTSKLYEAVTKRSGDEAMPQAPYQPLTQQQLTYIYLWIQQGADSL